MFRSGSTPPARPLSRLDKARQSVQRELSELDRKHTPKLGNTSETMLEGEVRAYLRTLPEMEMTGTLLEAIGAGDLVTLRAVLLAPAVLLSIPEHVLVEVKAAYAPTLDPEGFERCELLDKALAMIERSGRKLMGEVHSLLPPQLVSALSNDKGAADRVEKLADAEFQRAQTESRVLGAEPLSIPPLSERLAAAARVGSLKRQPERAFVLTPSPCRFLSGVCLLPMQGWACTSVWASVDR